MTVAEEVNPIPAKRVPALEAQSVSPWAEPIWAGFFLRFGLTLGSLLLAVAIFNYCMNPMALYETSLFPSLAWNARSIKPELLSRMQPRPEALILGSSRSWKIAPAEVQRLTGLRTFNLAVDGGMAEDDYLLLQHAITRLQIRPKLVIVGVDVETFHNTRNSNNLGVDYRVIQAREFGEFMPLRERIIAKWTGFTRLFVLQQTQLSWKSLKMAVRHRLTGTMPSKGVYESDPDGLVHFNLFESERSRGSYDLNKKIATDVPNYIRKFDSYTSLSPERLAYFDRMLQLARSQGAHVYVFLPPLQPKMESALQNTPFQARRQEAVYALQQMCAKDGADFHDYSDLRNFGGSPDWFFDGMHMNEQNSDLITSLLLVKERNAVQ